MNRRSFVQRAAAWVLGLVGLAQARPPSSGPLPVGIAFEVGDLVGLDEKGQAVNLSTVRYDGNGGFKVGPWRPVE